MYFSKSREPEAWGLITISTAGSQILVKRVGYHHAMLQSIQQISPNGLVYMLFQCRCFLQGNLEIKSLLYLKTH